MKRRLKIRRIGLVSTVAVLILAIVVTTITSLSHSAAAAVSETDLLKKTLLNGLRTCVADEYMQKEIAPIDYSGISSLMTSKGKDDGTILVPNGVANTLNDNDVSCKELFTGYDGWGGKISGLLSLYGKSDDNLTDFGYEINETISADSSRLGCVSYEYGYTKDNRQTTGTTNEICLEVGPDNKVVGYSEGIISRGEADGPIYLLYDPMNYSIAIYSEDIYYGAINQVGTGIGALTWEEFVERFTNAGNSITGQIDTSGLEPVDLGYNFRSANTKLEGGEAFNMATRKGTARLDILQYLTGNPSENFLTIQFTPEDKYSLYAKYFNDVLAENSSVYFAENCSASRDDAASETGYAVRSGSEWCGVYGVDSVSGTFNGINNGNTGLTEMSFADIVNGLMNLDYDALEGEDGELGEITDEGISGGVEDDGTAADGDASTMAACYKSAGALGWILCPVVGGLSEAVNGIYGSIEENFLMVEPEVVGDDGAYNGWVIFRDFANLVFVILFIIVILSQVTGVGISNYGIKKTLPRLIVVVVLVNVSFILCQLAVDLSNILGASLNSLFVDLAGRIAGSSGVFDLGGTIGEIGNFLLTVSGAGVTIAGGIALGALTWEYWLVPFLLVLLTVVISIIFFFILLGVRKAGIIILVALAPIAIVCYALPNTKKIFDRWLKMLSGLLMVYPICGLLMGGGKFASTLILNNIGSSGDTSFILALVAMLLTAVPFFFIPSLLRSSMAAMGNLGAKISGFGSRLGHGASGAIKRSERVQDWNKRLRVNTQYRRAQRSMTRAEKKGRTVSASQARRIARAKAAYEKQGIEDATNQLYAGRSGAQIAAAVAAAGMAAEDKDVKEAAESIETQYRKSGMDYRLDDLQKEHMDALNTLIADPTNREAKARLMAAHNLLSATDPGRGIMKNNFYSATGRLQSQGVTESAGLAWAAQSLHRSQGGNIKSHDRGFEKYLTKAAEGLNKVDGSFTTGTIGQRDDGSLIQGTVSSHYDVDAMNGYTSSSLADVDEGVLDRWLQATKDGHAAQMSDVDKDNFLSMSENMLTNENISVQPKIAAKVNAIRKSLGASEITPAVRGTSSSTDSGSLNPRTQTTGDVLRTGNDDHAPAQPAPAQSSPISAGNTVSLPVGWKRASQYDVSRGRVDNLTLKEGDWIKVDEAGKISRLNAEELQHVRNVAQHNSEVSIKNASNNPDNGSSIIIGH